jgi:predicted flap endonuclease-1-like 5' DNA nuclease
MFLLSQILVFLALALIIGGLIGYAFHACIADNEREDLRAALSAEQSRPYPIVEPTTLPEAPSRDAVPLSMAPFPSDPSDGPVTPVALSDLTPRDLEHALLAAAPGKSPKARFERNDLTMIKGLTPDMDAFLATIGITRIADLTDLTAQELYWLVDNLPGNGASLYRDQWIAQAAALRATPAQYESY